MGMSAESDMLSALTTNHSPELVCNCHDCTQARGLMDRAWLIEILDRLEEMLTHICGEVDEVRDRIEPTRRIEEAVARIEATVNVTQQQLESALARIEQSQATLTSETMVLVLTKLLKLESGQDDAIGRLDHLCEEMDNVCDKLAHVEALKIKHWR